MIRTSEELRKDSYAEVKKETEDKILEKEQEYEKLEIERLKIEINKDINYLITNDSTHNEDANSRIQDIYREEEKLKKEIKSLQYRLEKINNEIGWRWNK